MSIHGIFPSLLTGQKLLGLLAGPDFVGIVYSFFSGNANCWLLLLNSLDFSDVQLNLPKPNTSGSSIFQNLFLISFPAFLTTLLISGFFFTPSILEVGVVWSDLFSGFLS